MTYTTIEVFWFHFLGALFSAIFIYSQLLPNTLPYKIENGVPEDTMQPLFLLPTFVESDPLRDVTHVLHLRREFRHSSIISSC